MDDQEMRDKMLAGEDTPVSDRTPHRGEAAGVDGGSGDPIQGGIGMAGGGSGGTSGSNQFSESGSGSPYGSGARRGEDTPGAFGEEAGDESAVDVGDGPRDNALKKLSGL